MKSKKFQLLLILICLSVNICGCKSAPEGTTTGDVFHAKDSVEEEVTKIVNEEEKTDTIQEIDCIIGADGNVMKIKAKMPEIPQNVYHLVLKENESLTKECLIDFMESDADNILDMSEDIEKEMRRQESENERAEEPAYYSVVFGTAPTYCVTDGKKTAEFIHGTGFFYQENTLYERCMSAYKNAEENIWNELGEKQKYTELTELLLDKLSKIGINEISVFRITEYSEQGNTIYQIEFTPSYDGMGVVYEWGSIGVGEILPGGTAWICNNNIASINMEACLGEIEKQEKYNEILSWEQVQKVLEVYLKDEKIHGSENVSLTEVHFLYYPCFSEEEDRVEMVPVWQIYIPMSKWIENEEMAEKITADGVTWNVCINAITGEIVRSE